MEEEGAVEERPRLFPMFDLEEKRTLESNYEDTLISMWLGGLVEHSHEEETINSVGVYDGYFDPWPTSFYNLAVNDPGFCLRRGGVPQPPHHMMLTGTPVVKDAGEVKFSITASEGGVDISSPAMNTLKHASRCVQKRYVWRSPEDMCWLGPVARWPTEPIVSDTDVHDSGEVEVSCASAFHMMRYIISGTSAISPLPKIVVDQRRLSDLSEVLHSMIIASSINSWICKTIAMGWCRSVKRSPEEETNCFNWYEVKPNRIGWFDCLFTQSYQWRRKSLFGKAATKDSGEVKFSMIAASKGGVDIKIGSHTMHVPKHSSARHTLVSMMLFARNLFDDTFSCAKSMVPTRILNLLGGSISSPSPKVHEAGWVPAKARPESRNAGVAGETPVGSIGRNSTSRVPVLFDVSKLADSEPGSTAIPLATAPAIAAEEDEDAAYYDAAIDSDTLHGMENTATGFAPAASLLEQNPLALLQTISDNSIGYMDGVCEVTHTKAEHNSVMEAAEEKTAATWLVATAAAHHATGNRGLLSCFTPGEPGRFLRSADGAAPMQVLGHGSVITDTVVLPNVLYVPGLTANLVSPSQLAELDYTVRFSRGACHIRSAADGTIVGKASAGPDGSFELDFLKVLPAT